MSATGEMGDTGFILLCAIVVFAVLWLLMRKYCPAVPSDEKTSGVEAPIGVVTHETSLEQPQTKTKTGDIPTVTQTQLTTDQKTLDTMAEVTTDKAHGGTPSAEQKAEVTLSPARRLTNAARRASVAVSRAVKEETAHMLVALSSGSEVVYTQSQALADPKTTDAEKQPSDKAQALADHKTETDEPQSEAVLSDAVTTEHRPPQDGVVSPGRRFANAARRMSMAASRAVKAQTASILESLATSSDVAKAPFEERTPQGGSPERTVDEGEARPTKVASPLKDGGGTAETDAKAQNTPSIPGKESLTKVAPFARALPDEPKDVRKAVSEEETHYNESRPTEAAAAVKDGGGAAATDSKVQESPSIPGKHSRSSVASLEATFTDKRKDAERPPEGTDEVKSSQPPTVPGVGSARSAPDMTSGTTSTSEAKGSVLSPLSEHTSARHPSNADVSHVEDSALPSREHTSHIGKTSHRHRRKSKKKSFSASCLATCDGLTESHVEPDIGVSSAKAASAADH